ncbi:hypothetical protein ACQB6R_04405 [Propionibacteriaceae bacterium G1746]
MMHELWDADLLLGRDPRTTNRVTTDDLVRWQQDQHITGGVLASLRAIHFDAASGNAEVATAATSLGLRPAITLETRDWLTARRLLDEAPDASLVRLAPQRQDCAPTHPGFRAMVNAALARGFTIFCEGDVRTWGPAFEGRGATVVFLDLSFYHLGDFLALAADEPGFHASTRLLNGPDSLEIVRDELGMSRLVFGSRQGFHEGLAAIQRLRTSRLSDDDRAAVAQHNLRRLLAEPREQDHA